MNSFISQASGEYIVFIDNDDYWDSDYLEVMISKLRENDSDCAMSSYTLVDNVGKKLDWYTPTLLDFEILGRIELKNDFSHPWKSKVLGGIRYIRLKYEYKNVISAPVFTGRHVIIGSTSVILPGVTLNEGSAMGSFSFVKNDIEAWSMNVGIPCKKIGERSKKLLELEVKYIEEKRENR